MLNLINKQWEIYFSMDDKREAKRELVMFEREIIAINKDLTTETTGLKQKIVRRSNYYLFFLAKFYSDWRRK